MQVHREITQLTPEDSFLVFERVKQDFDFPIHFHPDFEMNFIHKGEGVRRVVGDNIEEIGEIELVLVGPNLIHGWEMHNCKSNKIHEITIHMHNDLIDTKLLSRRIFKPIKNLFERANHGILFSKEASYKMMPRLIELAKTDSIDYYLEFIHILYDLAKSDNQRLLSSYASEADDFENSLRLKKVHDYVQENFHKNISLAQISELVNMSPISFNRFIKNRVGRTFVTYLNDTRIGFATRWLIETDLSISEIGYKCGFNNIANFNRIFKKSKNCTPSEFREEFYGIKRVL